MGIFNRKYHFVVIILFIILPVIGSDTNDTFDLFSKIKEARVLLQSESVDLIKDIVAIRRVKVGRRQYKQVPVIGIVSRQMAIAVMNSRGEIQLVRAIKKEKGRGLEVLTPGFILSMRRENGINSDIACLQPANGKVLAVRYPISNANNRFGLGESVIQAVYTPFSPEIKVETVVKVGLKVQSEFINKAFERLESRDIKSAAFPSKKVSQVIPKQVLKVLLINEHIDPSLFKSVEMAKPLSEQVLTIIATNRERAYAYSISSAGARGLVQMIPSTYRMILKKYPLAGLNSDYSSGMVDPVNAIMAQILLCDADWQAILNQKYISKEEIGPYLAAAYNGGVGRVLSLLKDNEVGWMKQPDANNKPTKTVSYRVPVKVRVKQRNSHRSRLKTVYVTKHITQAIFRNETSNYIKQYHWIENALTEIKDQD